MTKLFLDPTFLSSETFLFDPKFVETQNLFDPKFNWTQKFLLKIFWVHKFFGSESNLESENNIGFRKMSGQKKFEPKKF